MECSKSDWRLFRSRITEWQENYMDRLNQEYIEILNGNEDASEKFWKLEERIRKDKKHPGVMMELSKQNMIYDIVTLIRDNVIEIESLEGFDANFQIVLKNSFVPQVEEQFES